MKYVFIVNPTAGRGRTGRLWPEIAEEVKLSGVPYQVWFTTRRGEATEMARRASQEENVTVVAVGGDGTVAEVVNGLAGSSTVLGVIPTGSGNDLARTIGLPVEPREACRVVLGGRPRPIDLGRVDGRYFINVAGAGFDAEICRMINEDLRWARGATAYFLATIATLFRYAPAPMTIVMDGREVKAEAMLVAVANGKYYGGGMKIAPQAEIDDGLFDVCIVEALSKPGFLQAFPKVYQGKHLTHPRVSLYRAKQVSLVSPAGRPLYAQADGELIGRLPLELTVVPQACHVLVPAHS